MHIKRLSSSLAVLAIVLLPVLAGACGGSADDASSDDGGTATSRPAARGNVDGALALGQLAPQTGSISSISKSLTTPVRIAVDEINAANGVNGQPVALAVADDGSGENPAVATASLDTLLDASKVDAVIGPTASGTALELLETIRDEGALTCSGSNSAEELTVADSGGYYFRTAPPDRLQAIALARRIVSEGPRRPVIIVRDDAYGDAFAAPLQRELRRGGAKPAGNVIRYNPGAESFAGVARRAAGREPDSVVAVSLVDDGAKLVNALTDAGIGPARIPLYAPDGMQSTTFHTKVNPTNPSLVAGIRGTAPAAAPAGPETAFTTALRRTGVAPIFSAHYYDCTILTALAAVKAGSDDPAKMKDAFAKNLRGTTDCTSYAGCVAALAEGKSIHYRGASSSFDRWEGHEPGQGTFDLWSYGNAGNVVTAPPAQQIAVP